MRKSWKGFFRPLLITTVLAAFMLALWAFWWEPRRFVVRRELINLPCWTGDSLLLAVASDLHVGSPSMGISKLDQLVEVINAARPDAVLLLGDFVIQGVIGGRFVPPELIAERLRSLRAPLGIYAVLGNHDWWLDGPRVERALEAVGITVLDDAAVPLRQGDSPFWLAGISDFWQGQYDVAATLGRVQGNAPVIVMTHNPDIFPSVPAHVCLTLAGHTHGGQVALPFIGRPVVPSRYGQRYAVGHVEERGKHLFVTSGVGTSILPLRFRVPPEVLLLRVHRVH